MKKKFIIGCAAVLMLTGCGTATLKNGEQIVAKMDGKKISAENLYDEMKKQGGASVLTNMIDEFVVNKEIKTDEDAESYADGQIKNYKEQYESYGMDFGSALLNAGYDSEDAFKKVLILDYKKKEVAENYVKGTVTDDDINAYYDENIYGDISAKHILIAPDADEKASDEEKQKAEEEAKKEAEKIIKKLDKGENFEELAKKYSDDKGTASKGGKLTVTYGSVVDEFWDATNKLEDGKYTTEPVKTEYGYHVIYRINQKEKPKLSKVKDDIIDKIVDKKIEDDSTLQTKALVELRKKYNLDVTDSDLKKSYNKSIESALNTSDEENSSN